MNTVLNILIGLNIIMGMALDWSKEYDRSHSCYLMAILIFLVLIYEKVQKK